MASWIVRPLSSNSHLNAEKYLMRAEVSVQSNCCDLICRFNQLTHFEHVLHCFALPHRGEICQTNSKYGNRTLSGFRHLLRRVSGILHCHPCQILDGNDFWLSCSKIFEVTPSQWSREILAFTRLVGCFVFYPFLMLFACSLKRCLWLLACKLCDSCFGAYCATSSCWWVPILK